MPKNNTTLLSQKLDQASRLTYRHPRFLGYLLAILSSALVILLKLGVTPVVGSFAPFLLLLPAVFVSSWFGGAGPGMLATLITTVAAWYFFLPPFNTFAVENVLTTSLGLIFYVIQSLLIVFVIYRRNKAYSEMQLRTAQQEVIAAIAQHGLEETDLNRLLDRIVKVVAKTLQVEYAKVLELLPDEKKLRLQAGVGWKRGLVRRATVGTDANSQAGYTLSVNKPVIVRDLRGEKRFTGPQLLRDHGVISGMSVVIPGSIRPYGVFGVHTTRERTFTKSDVNFLQTVANVLATTLEQRYSHQSLRLMTSLNTALLTSLDPKQSLSQLMKVIVPDFSDFCEVYVKSDETRVELVQVGAVSKDKQKILEKMAKRYPPTSESKRPTAAVLRSGRAQLHSVVTSDMIKQLSSDDKHLELYRQLKMQSAMIIPLKIRQRVIGAITFGTVEKGQIYTQRDFQLAKEIADRVAVAIDNSMLYQEAKDAVQARDEFLSIASHELKTPLTSMLLQLQTILHSIKNESMAKFSVEKTMTMLEGTVTQSKRLSKLVNDLLNVSLISTGRLELEKEKTDLTKVTADVIERLNDHIKRSGSTVTFTSEKSVTGHWDKIRLEQLITNLITNAVKYGNGKPIAVSVANSNQTARLSVSDKGIGIPKDKQEAIFKRFERGDVKDMYQGLGVGLYLANEIVRAHGGVIQVESQADKGSTFTVELPLKS